MTALNPKAIGFFIAFVPQFIDVQAALWSQSMILIPTFVVIGATNALMYALMAAYFRQTIRKLSIRAWVSRASGGVLVAMGMATAVLQVERQSP